MYLNRSVLAVIPARGGSKGIKLKNLRKVMGKTLIEHVAEVLSELEWIDQSVVSSDHDQIIQHSLECSLDVPFVRPDDISGDTISDFQVLEHALLESERYYDQVFDIVLMLQPTSPLRTSKDIQDTVNLLIKGSYDSVWTVSETDLKYHPLKQLNISNGKLDYQDQKGSNIIARQQLNPTYHRNGVAYAFTRECLLGQKTILGKNSGGLILENINISIDTLEDIAKIEEINKLS